MQPTETEWEVIASKTVKRWQYPKGKHISFVHPKDSGFDFYYKNFFTKICYYKDFCYSLALYFHNW